MIFKFSIPILNKNILYIQYIMCLPVVSDVSGENHVMVFEYGNVILYTINNIDNANHLVVIDGMPFQCFLYLFEGH